MTGIMAYLIDGYFQTKTEIEGKWVIARPLLGSFISRLKDAWLVLTGKADAVKFHEQ